MQPHRSSPRARAALVTGGAGFIGGRLTRRLADRGWRVLVVDDLSSGRVERIDPRAEWVRADVRCAGRLGELLHGAGPFTHLVHLAGRVGVRRVLADPEGCRHLQVEAARSLVHAVASLPPGLRPRVLAASTSEVYAEDRRPLSEASALRPGRGTGRWAYAGSKLVAERTLDEAAALWRADEAPIHLRFFNVVGPDQDLAGGQVLPTFVDQALRGAPVTVHGDGRQVRTFGHVEDVACALVHVAEQPAFPAGPLNLGGTARTRIASLARLVVRTAGSSSPVVHVDPRAEAAQFEEVLYRVPSLARARSLGVPLPARSIEAIVADTLAPAAAAGAG